MECKLDSGIINVILNIIENNKIEMHNLAMQFGFSHPQVIKASQKIDEKINEYNRLVYAKQTF